MKIIMQPPSFPIKIVLVNYGYRTKNYFKTHTVSEYNNLGVAHLGGSGSRSLMRLSQGISWGCSLI